MEVSTRSGVATPGALGVVIRKVWAEAADANVAARKAAVSPARSWRHGFVKLIPRAANRGMSLYLSELGLCLHIALETVKDALPTAALQIDRVH